MLRITLELVPWGDDFLARPIGQMVIGNDSKGTLEMGDYFVKMSHASPDGAVVTREITGFPRKELNAWHLLQWALEACLENKDESGRLAGT